MPNPTRSSKPSVRPRYVWSDWRHKDRLETLDSLRRRYSLPLATPPATPPATPTPHVYFDDHRD